MADVAYILFGRGAGLGNFSVFARSLKTQLRTRFHNHVYDRRVERRDEFFDALEQPHLQHATDRIAELHVFSHSIGGGLFLGYHDPILGQQRDSLRALAGRRGLRLSYAEVVMDARGVVFTDSLIRPPYSQRRARIRRNFAPNATIKLWGCNAGRTGWVYSDPVARGGQWDYVVAASAGRVEDYYWRALNEQNMPKPSIAQAFADYFDRTAYGATSGSHIEVFDHGRWVKSSTYAGQHGGRVPPSLLHRLEPDVGNYHAYHPARQTAPAVSP